jgi:hypothetical protein
MPGRSLYRPHPGGRGKTIAQSGPLQNQLSRIRAYESSPERQSFTWFMGRGNSVAIQYCAAHLALVEGVVRASNECLLGQRGLPEPQPGDEAPAGLLFTGFEEAGR